MARDSTQHKVRSSLKQAGIKPFKYTKDIGKALLFDSLPNQFSESLPTLGSIYQTGSDTAASLSSFASSRTDVLKHGIDKFFNNEAVGTVTRQAKTILKQVKSGSLYTPTKDEDLFGSLNDGLLDNFGGVDMTYDDDGEYVETSSSPSTDNVNIAAVQNRADNERTKAMMSAIGSSAEAQMKWAQTLTQSSLQVQAKFHDETLSAMRNQLTISSAIYETMNTRLSEMQTMLAEANRSLVTDVSEIKGYLKTISSAYTNKNKFKGATNNDPLANGFSIDAYIAQVKKNFGDSELGLITSMVPMMMSLSRMDTRKKNNPILYLTDAIAKAIIPSKTKKRMERSDKTINAFADALLSKLADMDGGNSIFGQIFGYKQKLNTTIKTARDLSYATHWTGKDSKALTDVIPTQLAQIISLMSGRPIQLFDYSSGTFKNGYKHAGAAYRDIHQNKSYSDVINTLRGRARKIDFGTDADNDEFQNYVEMFINNAIQRGSNINPYKNGFNPLEGTNAKREYATAITGLLKSLGKNGLIELGSEIQSSRSDRSYRANAVNSELVESSMIMAFSQIGMTGLDENGQDRLLTKILGRVKDKDKPISSREIMRMMRQAKSGASKTGPNSVQSLLRDIRNIIRRGIITYSYGISNGGSGTPVPPGFDDALKDARAARRMVTRKVHYTNSDATKRVGGVTNSERQSILRDVRIGGLSQTKLEQYANKLGYGSVNELIDKANSEGVGVSGDTIRYRKGMTSAEIAQQMKNRDLIDESSSMLESFTERHGNENVKSKFGKAKTSMDSFRSRISSKFDKFRSPFKLMDYALDSLDSAMFKILYGDIPDEDKDDQKSVMDLIRAAIETQTNKFGDFLNEKLDFIDDKLFGKEGLFSKFAKWASGKLVGTRGEDGRFSGGKFSDLANKAMDTGKSGVSAWTSAMKEQIIGVKSKASKRVRGFDGQWKSVNVGYQGGLIQPLRDKVEDLKEWLFGKKNEITDSKKLASDIGKELKDAAPSMGKGAAIGVGTWLASGLLTGMFLPSGPLLSGLIGSTTGLIKKSDKLREYLFGKEDEEGKHSGGLFSDTVYKGLTKYIPNIAKGAGIGAMLGNFGLLPFGLGNMAGLIFGSMGGMIKSSDELRTFLFGTEDDDNSGLINKKLRNRLKDIIPGWLIGKTTGSALWNIISNAGLIPGLALLPGGPVFSAIGGLVGAFSKEHVENFLFGKKDKDGKRDDSGVFSKAFGALKDRVMSPLAEKINKIGDNIGGWFKEVVTENLKDFFSPVTELFKRGLNKMRKKSMDITDILRGAFATVIDKTLGRFFKFIGRKLFGKKGEDGKRKGGIIRTVASMPFQALGAIGRKMTAGINWADRRFEAKEYRRYQKQLKKDKKAGTAWQDEAGNWHVADEEAFNAESQNRREKRGTGGNFWDTVEEFRQRGQKSRENADARAERYRKAREEKEKAKEQGDATAEAVAPHIETIGSGVNRTNSLLEDILRTLGGTPSTDENGNKKSTSSTASSGETQNPAASPNLPAVRAASNIANNVMGNNQVLRAGIGAAKKGFGMLGDIGRLASKAKKLYSGYKSGFMDFGDSMVFNSMTKKGQYLLDLYKKADRAMSSATDPRKVADELIADVDPEFSEEAIEIINRVYNLNAMGGSKSAGGSDGKDTGLLDTLKSISKNVSPIAMLLSAIVTIGKNILSGGWLTQILSGIFPWFNNKKTSDTAEKAAEAAASSANKAGTSALTKTTSASSMLPEGDTKRLLLTDGSDSSSTSKTGIFSKIKSKLSGLKSGATSIGGAIKSLGSKAISSARNFATDLANPIGSNKISKSMYKGARIGQALSLPAYIAAGASGALLDEDEKSDTWYKNLGKTILKTPEMMKDWYTSNGGLHIQEAVATTMSNNPLNKSPLRGIGNLSFSEMKTAATKGADAVATGVSAKRAGAVAMENVANNSITKVISNICTTFKNGLNKALNGKIAKTLLGSSISKKIGSIATKVADAFKQKLPNILGKMTKTESAKMTAMTASSVLPQAKVVSLIVFGLYDAITGATQDARVNFKVASEDVTLGMRVASGIAKLAQGVLIQILPYFRAPGWIGTAIVAMIPTSWLANLLYKLFADDEAESELKSKQDAYYNQYKEYMAQKYPDLAESDYESKYSFEKWRKENDPTFTEKVGNTVKSAASTVKNAAVSAASAVKNFFTGDNKKSTTSTNSSTDSSKVSAKTKKTNDAITIVTTGLTAIYKIEFVKSIIGNHSSEITKLVETEITRVAQNLSGDKAFTNMTNKDLVTNKAINAFYVGYRNPGNYLDMDGEDMSDRQSVAAGIGAAVASITNGAIRGKTIATSVSQLLEVLRAKSENKSNSKLVSTMSTSASKISSLSPTEAASSDSADIETATSNRSSSSSSTKKSGGVFSTIKNAVTSAFSKFTSWITGKGRGNGRGHWGRGEYFSQTDPKWNQYDPDMKNSGCGPTVAAMMASHYGKGRWGRVQATATPAEADMMSKELPGMRDADGGTNPDFFRTYGASKGINMTPGAPDKKSISDSLRSGNAVGLMGEGGPFGSNMHYMMADGIDASGNANVVDPYGGTSRKIPLSSVTSKTKTAIYGSGRYGRGDTASKSAPTKTSTTKIAATKKSTSANTKDPNNNKLGNKLSKSDLAKESKRHGKIIKGGKGGKFFGRFGRGRWGRGTAKEQAAKVMQIAQGEVGYLEKASEANLDDKKANAGNNNWTKYGKWFGLNGGDKAPWCAMFVSWCLAQAGVSTDIAPKTAGVNEFYNFFKGKGQYHGKSGYTPQTGDIIIMGSPSTHVGLVLSSDGTNVTTIEGNTSGQGAEDEGNGVYMKTYPISDSWVYGFCTPAYDGNMVSFDGGSTSGSTGSSDSGNSYSGVFGSFQKVFDQVQSQLDSIFAPLTGSSSSSSSGDSGSTGSVGAAGSDSGGTLSGGSEFPKYTLTDAQKKFIAGVSSQEQNESDISAQRLEVSQMANLNEVEYNRKNSGDDLMKTLKGGWYAQSSVNRGNSGSYSPQAMKAVEEVLEQGKRTLPRHVTEHDFYGDITNIDLNPSTASGKQNRKNIKPGDTIKNSMGSVYQFYKFAGKDGPEGSGDPFGSKSQYLKAPYTEDVPWGSGRGRGCRGRGPSEMDIYNAGGINGQVKAMNASMASAKANDRINRKMDAVDTQAKAMQKAASSGAYGKGSDSAAVTQIAKAMTQVVELLTEIRDQNATFTKAAETKRSNKTRNPLGSQTKLNQNDPGTSSMRKMAIRS